MVGFQHPRSQDATVALLRGDLECAASCIEKDGQPNELHDAIVLYLLTGQLGRARKLHARLPRGHGLNLARTLGLEAIIAVGLSEYDAAAETLTRARTVVELQHRLWPTWSFLSGIVESRRGAGAQSARAFLGPGAERRGYSTLPVRYAKDALNQAGLSPPLSLATLTERRYILPKETVEAGLLVNSEFGPELPNASGIQGENSHQTLVENQPHFERPTAHPPAASLVVPPIPDLADRELQSRLSALHSAVSDLLGVLGNIGKVRDISTLQIALREAEAAQARAMDADGLVRACSTAGPDFPDPLEKQEAGSPEAWASHLRLVIESASRVDKQRTREIADKKSLWRDRCIALGEAVPQGLEEASTPYQLDQIVSEIQKRIAARAFENAIRSNQRCPDWVQPTPRDRLSCYEKVLTEHQAVPDTAARVLEVAISDTDALASAKESALAMLAGGVRLFLQTGIRLPAGTWAALAGLAPGAFDATINSLGLGEWLSTADPEHADASGLLRVTGAESTLPSVSRLVRLQEVRATTDPERRLHLLAGLMETDSADFKLVHDFVIALAAAGRAAMGLMVASRSNESFPDEFCWCLIVQSALEAKFQGHPEPTLYSMVQDEAHAWLVTAEDALALLVLADREQRRELLAVWQYQFAEAFRLLELKYPWIVFSLGVASNDRGRDLNSDDAKLRAAQGLVAAFLHDMQSEAQDTTLPSWQLGDEQYRAWVAQELKHLLERTVSIDENRVSQEGVSLEGFLSRAEKSGLALTRGQPGMAARSYLQKQLSRLNELARAVAGRQDVAGAIRSALNLEAAHEIEELCAATGNRCGWAAAIENLIRLEQR